MRLTLQLSNDDDIAVSTIVECTYDGDSAVEFTFPSGVFTDRDWVILELTFDDITWFLVEPDRIAVVEQAILTRTWPSHVYLHSEGVEIYLQAGELSSADRGGDIWNMEYYDNMQCKFISTGSGSE